MAGGSAQQGEEGPGEKIKEYRGLRGIQCFVFQVNGVWIFS